MTNAEFKTAHDLPPCSISVSNELTKTGNWRNSKPVFHKEKCIQCGICWKVCPNACIELGEYPTWNMDYCKGCGVCAEECPKDAIEMIDERVMI